jgi:NADH:ubiquinone oxidoreductase subunit F (NADH-binding)/(2Fe-2S) ferredoxin
MEVLDAMRVEAVASGLEVSVNAQSGFVGCRGFCSEGPLVHLPESDILYCRVTPEDAGEILRSTVARGEVIERLLYRDPVTRKRSRGIADNPFFSVQDRRVLARCGVVDPDDIGHAVELGAYRALTKAVRDLDGSAIIDRVKRSGLQERGGAGFPVGLKWAVVAEASDGTKVVVGNGDSGESGLGVDRTLLEGDPHGVIEGLIIAGVAVGAESGRLFLRSDHELGIARVEHALAESRSAGFLGNRILDSDLGFEIEVCESAGKSMGGEETSMLNALEGRRAAARPRPPFPAVCGLWGRPTLINTLETLANIPLIVGSDPDDRSTRFGHTKVVGLSGRVTRPGLAEVPLGTSVGEIVSEIGGGCGDDAPSAVHLGGPGGATLNPDQLGTPLDYAAVRALGANLGSAGMLVLGRRDCPVALARTLVRAGADSSCGTCPPCRIGLHAVLNLLDRIETGAAETADLDRLERLGIHIGKTSLCELGKNASRSLLASMESFRSVFESHLGHDGCPIDDSGETCR